MGPATRKRSVVKCSNSTAANIASMMRDPSSAMPNQSVNIALGG